MPFCICRVDLDLLRRDESSNQPGMAGKDVKFLTSFHSKPKFWLITRLALRFSFDLLFLAVFVTQAEEEPSAENGILERADTTAGGGAPSIEADTRAPAASIATTLQKDAYLVFRALCKLSIRSSDNSAGTDLTVLRGKVCPSRLKFSNNHLDTFTLYSRL